MTAQKFWGKYRGKVLPGGNIDPLGLFRLLVDVPAVGGPALGTQRWALPCVPYAGPGVGFVALPPEGANVWVEFEGGDPTYAIWSGCFWADDGPLFSGVPPLPGGVLGAGIAGPPGGETPAASGAPTGGAPTGGAPTAGAPTGGAPTGEPTPPTGAPTPPTGAPTPPTGAAPPPTGAPTGAEPSAGGVPSLLPPVPCDPNKKVFQTPSVTLIIDDTPEIGGVYLTVHSPAAPITTTLTIDTNGLHILSGPETHVDVTPINVFAEVGPISTVNLNPGALSVMTTEVSVVALATISGEAATAITLTAPAITITGATAITGPTIVATAPDVTVIAPATFNVTTGVSAIIAEETNTLTGTDVNIAGVVTVEGETQIVGAAQVTGDFEAWGTLEAGPGTFAGPVTCVVVIPLGLV